MLTVVFGHEQDQSDSPLTSAVDNSSTYRQFSCDEERNSSSISEKISVHRHAQDIMSKQKHLCSGITFAAIAESTFGAKLNLIIPFVAHGTAMVYKCLGTEITVHISGEGVLSLFSAACDPASCGSCRVACHECASTELGFSTPRILCTGMDMVLIVDTLGAKLQGITKFLKIGGDMVFEDVEEDLTFRVSKSTSQLISLFCVECTSDDVNDQGVCPKCLAYQAKVLSVPCKSAVMIVPPQPEALLARIECILLLWRTKRRDIMKVGFPRPALDPRSDEQLFLRLPRGNSKLGDFDIYVNEYITNLGSNYLCEIPTSLSIPVPAHREWLNDTIVGILPFIAQAIAPPNIFVLDSAPLYNMFFKYQLHLKEAKLSDLDLQTQFRDNFTPRWLPIWSFVFEKNVTMHMVVHSGVHFSNVIIGNINNSEDDANPAYFASIDCLKLHNSANILHNTKRYICYIEALVVHV